MCKAQCAGCGYLAVQHRATRALVEVEDRIRETWEIPPDATRQQELYDRIPCCFVQAFDLRKEVPDAEIRGNKVQKGTVLSIINKERECAEFTEWTQGLSPKEHFQMSIIQAEKQRLEEQRQRDLERDERRIKEEEQRRIEDLNWRAEQEQKSEERWRADQQAAEERSNREYRLQRHQLLIVGIVGTIILAVAQIVGSLIQAGIMFPQEKEPPVININIPAEPAKK